MSCMSNRSVSKVKITHRGQRDFQITWHKCLPQPHGILRTCTRFIAPRSRSNIELKDHNWHFNFLPVSTRHHGASIGSADILVFNVSRKF